jgi:hypothetical protein
MINDGFKKLDVYKLAHQLAVEVHAMKPLAVTGKL